MKKNFTLIIAVLFLFLGSCTKEEGIGGTSTITGKVYVYNYNAELTNLRWEGYGISEDVYIIYGNDTIYSDRFWTNFDGSYRFQFLRQGTYTIFTYSKNLENVGTNHTDIMIPVKKIVEITETNQVVIVNDFYIIK